MMPLPTVLSYEPGAEVRFVLSVPADHLAFAGHFPDNPILPGVIQVDWAARFGAEAFGDLGQFTGIHNLKFMDLVRPDEPLALHLAWDAGSGRLNFRYEGESSRKSSGILLFAK